MQQSTELVYIQLAATQTLLGCPSSPRMPKRYSTGIRHPWNEDGGVLALSGLQQQRLLSFRACLV